MDRIKKRINSFSRWVFILFGLFILLFTSAVLLIRLPAVQTRFVSEAVSFVYDKWGIQIGLEKLFIGFTGSIELEGLVLYDKDCDTLISLQGLSANISFYNIYAQRLLFKSIELDQPYMKLYYDSLQDVNIEYFIDMFPDIDSLAPIDSTESDFFLKSYNLIIKDGRFSFDCRNLDTASGIHHICPTEISNLQFEAEDVVFVGGEISFHIDTLSFYDADRLSQVGLSGTGYVNNGTVALTPLAVTTSKSDIRLSDFIMTAPAFGDYAEFCSTVRMKAGIIGASVALSDVSRFASFFEGSSDVFFASGIFSGVIDDFKLKNALLRITDSSYFAGSVEIMDVTVPTSMFCAIEADSCRFYYDDVRRTSMLGEEHFPSLYPIPLISKFPSVEYSGNLTGYYNDFVSEGNVIVSAGSIHTDLKITTSADGGLSCKGLASMDDFQLGHILSPAQLWGAVSGRASLNASIPKNNDYSFNGEVAISSLEFNGYEYTDLFLNARYSKKKFDGKVVSDDPNLQLEIQGSALYTDSVWNSDFVFAADRICISALGFMPTESLFTTSFSGRLTAWMQSTDIFGLNATFNTIDFKSSSGNVADKNSTLQYLQNKNSRFFNLQSKYLNASVKGTFSANDLIAHGQQILSVVVPQVTDAPNLPQHSVSLRTRMFSDSLSRLINLMTPMPFSCSEGFLLDAVFDSKDGAFNFNSSIPFLIYGTQRVENISVDATYSGGFVTGEIIADLPMQRRNFPRADLTFSGDSTGILSEMSWRSSDSEHYRGSIVMEHHWLRDSLLDSLQWHIDILPGELAFADTLYRVTESKLILMNNYLSIDNFTIGDDERYLGVNGVFSGSEKDTVNIRAENLELGSFNSLLSEFGIILKGNFTGSISGASAFNDPVFEMNANVDRFNFNMVDFGQVEIESHWDRPSKKMNFSAQATKQSLKILDISGMYSPKKKYLELDANIDSLDITFIDPFLEDVLGFKRGWVKGSGKVKGPLDSLKSSGQFYARDFMVRTDFLNTVYTVDGPFGLHDGKLKFQGLKVADLGRGTGVLDGYFSVGALPRLDFDILIKYNKLHSLNTKVDDNDLFYGKASSTGAVRLSDNEGKLHIAVAAQVEEGSRIFIPISGGSNSSETNILRFISDSDKDEVELKQKELISMDIEINLKPDSEVQLIMDEQLGDIIKASGNGNVAISVNDKSEVSIMGEYRIQQGDYLFTMMNLMNKRFKIEPNSVIYFSGKLDDATVDLKAIYETKASVQPLMGADSAANYGRRTRVECVLWLTGNLFNPDIHFIVNLPDQQGKVSDKLLSLSEDERNRQFLALLVLNRFAELEGSTTSRSATSAGDGYVNSMEVLSNQFSNWLSGMSRDFDFGVNYRPGDDRKNLSDELELGISAQMFNNRMIIDYSRSTNLGAETPTQQKADNNVGDVSVEVKLTENGKLRLRGFSRSGNDDPILNNGAQTNGVGIIFTDEFDRFSDLFIRRKKKSEKANQESKNNQELYRKEDDNENEK